jgi:nucleotide-binding universal stress UspA family protein
VFRTIVVPLDGSPLAERALPYAAALAGATGAQVILLRAAQPRPDPGADAPPAWAPEEDSAYLADARTRLRARGAALVEGAVSSGEAAAAIRDEARLRRADLVVLATHGRSGLGRALSGGVADDVLRRAEVPVLLVPPAAPPAWPARLPAEPRRVVVPLDGSPFAEAALPPARGLAAALGAELHLLRAVPPAGALLPRQVLAPAGGEADAARREAGADLEATAAPLRAGGLRVVCHPVVADPAAGLAGAAKGLGADAIAMATHGRAGLTRLVLGSVATAALRRATVPLLLVRPAPLRQSETERVPPGRAAPAWPAAFEG